jgi:hypothetical protein
MSGTTRLFCLVQLLANALLLWLAYEWLTMSESTMTRLAWSGTFALAIVTAATLLHGATFASFRKDAAPGVGPSFRTALRHLLPLLLVVLAALAVYVFLAWWTAYSATPAAKLASWLTLKFRKPVRPAAVLQCLNVILWIVRWVLLPAELLPLFSGVASRGWRGFGEFGWRRYSRLDRLVVPLLVLCGFWLPFRLWNWAPHAQEFAMQMTSFVLRTVAAYLLFVSAAMVLAYRTSHGKPADFRSR